VTASELLDQGNPSAALAAAQESVRARPRDAEARALLFDAYCLTGQWAPARAQLDIMVDLDKSVRLLKPLLQGLLAAEPVRADVFAGRRTPEVLGPPEEWMAWLIHANALAARHEWSAARDLRSRALAAAPPVSGLVNGEACEGLTDIDERFGPVLEAILNGTYLWVPLERIRSIRGTEPSRWRDFAWYMARFTWSDGNTALGFIPVRYPGTENSKDGELLLARKTDWVESGEGWFSPLGQRMLRAGSAGREFSLLDIREIDVPAARGSEAQAPSSS
jgi:type VI secretion system protein ImpE